MLTTDLFFFNELKKKGTLTNCYILESDLFNDSGSCKYEFRKEDGLITLFSKTHYRFKRMFFYLDKEFLSKKADVFYENDFFVSEVIFSETQKEQNKVITNWFKKNENFHYRTFIRMFKVDKPNLNKIDFSKIENPNLEDLNEIKCQLEFNFDILTERIPSLIELEKLRESTYIIKENNKLAAILISEKKGKTEELRYWLVLPDYRSFGYGGLLMKFFLISNNETARYTLWVDISNIEVIKKYEHYGFQKDRLLNKIFINKTIMKEKIIAILRDTRPEFEFDIEGVNFIKEGYLDSFDLITIVADLENTFDTKISGSLIVPESFQSVDSIISLIQNSDNAS
jgi:acyl carrier protein